MAPFLGNESRSWTGRPGKLRADDGCETDEGPTKQAFVEISLPVGQPSVKAGKVVGRQQHRENRANGLRAW